MHHIDMSCNLLLFGWLLYRLFSKPQQTYHIFAHLIATTIVVMAESNSSSSSSSSSSHQVFDSMDRLWFHQVILSSDPTSVLCSKSALQSPSNTSSESSLLEGETVSTIVCASSISQNESNDEVEDKRQDEVIEDKRHEENCMEKKRLSNLEILSNKFGSKSSSPSIQRPRRSLNLSNDEGQKFQKFLSCRKLLDLELEELKGFMDLGFEFETDKLSPRTMRVLPGLQRLGHDNNNNVATNDHDEIEGTSEETIVDVDKPYLSESWPVKRPDSPLLRMRMARVSKAEDMKECLKLWAKTVASSMPIDD